MPVSWFKNKWSFKEKVIFMLLKTGIFVPIGTYVPYMKHVLKQ
jgi:hypothetical protein